MQHMLHPRLTVYTRIAGHISTNVNFPFIVSTLCGWSWVAIRKFPPLYVCSPINYDDYIACTDGSQCTLRHEDVLYLVVQY